MYDKFGVVNRATIAPIGGRCCIQGRGRLSLVQARTLDHNDRPAQGVPCSGAEEFHSSRRGDREATGVASGGSSRVHPMRKRVQRPTAPERPASSKRGRP